MEVARTACQGGLDETPTVPPERAARPDAASSVAPVPSRYERSLRPCLGTTSAPRRRAEFRQSLLTLDREGDVHRGPVLADAVALDDGAHRGHVRARDPAHRLRRLLNRRVGGLREALRGRTDHRDHLGDVCHVSLLSIVYCLAIPSVCSSPRSPSFASARSSSSTSTPTRKMIAEV